MRRLPRLTGQEVLRALQRAGFEEARTRGSHHFVAHRDDPTRWATAPIHGGHVLPLKTLQSVLKTARLSADELRHHL